LFAFELHSMLWIKWFRARGSVKWREQFSFYQNIQIDCVAAAPDYLERHVLTRTLFPSGIKGYLIFWRKYFIFLSFVSQDVEVQCANERKQTNTFAFNLLGISGMNKKNKIYHIGAWRFSLIPPAAVRLYFICYLDNTMIKKAIRSDFSPTSGNAQRQNAPLGRGEM